MEAPEQLHFRQCRLFHSQHLDVRTFDSITEVREVFRAYHAMPVPIARNPIDEIDQAVFHSTHKKVMDNVHDERRCRHSSNQPDDPVAKQ
jgi:hypothetical protein